MCAGQSNAAGRGNIPLSPIPAPGTAFEYSEVLQSCQALADPTGTYYNGLDGANTGSAWPAFAQTYHNITLDTVFIVTAARGNTSIIVEADRGPGSWGLGDTLFERAVEKTDLAIANSGLPLSGILWCQGETDAISIMNHDIDRYQYRAGLITLIARFRALYGCNLPFYIIGVGSDPAGTYGFRQVREEQEWVAKHDPYTYVVYRETQYFHQLGLMRDAYHYNQDGLNNVGSGSATRIVEIEDSLKVTITASGDYSICPGDSLVLEASPDYAGYLWTNGKTDPVITVFEPGFYSVSVTDSTGCSYPFVDSVKLGFDAVANISVLGPVSFCQGGVVDLEAAETYPEFYWSTGDTTPTISLNQSTDVYLIVTDSAGCNSFPSDTVHVIVHPLPAKPVIQLNGGSEFCENDSVVLSVLPGFDQYNWNNGFTQFSETVYSSGIFYLTITDSNSCESPVSDSVSILVNPLPFRPGINWNGPLVFCESDSLVMVATGSPWPYFWPDGSSDSTLSVNISGDYFVHVVDSNGCRSLNSDTLQILVNPLPPRPLITAGGPLTFCDGATVVLSAPLGSFVYDWNNGDSTQNAIVSIAGNYWLSITDSLGCESELSDTVTVWVDPLPARPQIGVTGALEFCQGDSALFSATPGYIGYAWNNGETQPSIWVEQSGSFFVSVTDSNNCLSLPSDTFIVLVNPLPPGPVINPSGPTQFCNGDSVELFVSPGGQWEYNWWQGDSLPSIIVYQSGVFGLTLTDSNNCEGPSSSPIFIVVNPNPPQPIIGVGGPLEFCQGDSVILTGPAGYTLYNWSDGETTQVNTVSYIDTLTLSVTDLNNCTSPISDSVEVTMWFNPPIAQIWPGGNTTFCQGDSLWLFAPGGYSQYFWNTGDTAQKILVSQTGNFSVQTVDSNGCTGGNSNFLAILALANPPQPQIISNGPNPMCQGDSLLLTANPAAAIVKWSNGVIGQSITVSTSGSYLAQNMIGFGCVSPVSQPFSVVVNPVPGQPQISYSDTHAVCLGDTFSVEVLGVYPGYLWTNGDSVQAASLTQGGWHFAQVSNQFGCWSEPSDSLFLQLHQLPATPAIQANNNTYFCNGDSVMLFVSPTAKSYLWSNGDTTWNTWISTTGLWTLSITDSNNCRSPLSTPVGSQALQVGNPGIVQTAPDTLMATIAGTSYLWLFNGLALIQNSRSIYANQAGFYRVVVQDGNCLSDTSSPYFLSPLTRNEEPGFSAPDQSKLLCWPNPAQDELSIRWEGKVPGGRATLSYNLTDPLGRTLMGKSFDFHDSFCQSKVDLSSLPGGTYWLNIKVEMENETRVFCRKIISTSDLN